MKRKKWFFTSELLLTLSDCTGISQDIVMTHLPITAGKIAPFKAVEFLGRTQQL
jgi:hypothetical protein